MAVVVAVLALITVGNVVLTMAVLRRLAAHERKLAAIAPAFGLFGGLASGAPVPAFLTETVDGERIDEARLTGGPAAVAFFAAHCETCVQHAPEYVALVEREGVAALAVVTGEGPTGAPLLAALTSLPVVREHDLEGPLARSFRVDAYPTYYALDHGQVVAGVGSAQELATLLAVPRGE
jgi:hypothetical protein